MDLIIHYPQGGLNRYMPNAFLADPPTLIDDFFGGTEWRTIYSRHQRMELLHIHRELIDLYRGQLQALGYQDVRLDPGAEPLIRNIEKNAPLYRLLFASKHKRGHDFWNRVILRDVHGQTRLPGL